MTLLLAVPITVLAVLALVPQEQGGLVSGCHKSSKGLTSGCASCLFLLSWLGCPPVGMSPLSLCWSSFHVPVMLLCPDVTKPLSGCLYVSSPLPKTYLGLCLSAQVQMPYLFSIPGRCVSRLGLVGETRSRACIYVGNGGGLASAKTELWAL